MKKLLFLLLIFILILSCFAVPAAAKLKECYWYCKRNSEHLQPQIDSNFSFVEECGGIYVDKNAKNDKVIYLTFDVGYENGNVGKIMDVLESEGVKATFFVLGHVIEAESELINRMTDGGHLVANHTVNHKNLVGADLEKVKSEIEGLEVMYRELTGKEMAKFFRPPEGTFDKELLLRVKELGYKTVFWSFAYADWDNKAQMREDVALKKILDNTHNGEIMLLHPTSATNANIMQELIRTLKAEGYRFATVDEIK